LAVLEQDYDLRDKEKIMPDIRTRVETVDNTGATQATLAPNFEKFVNNTSDAGRELIVSITKSGSGNLTDATLLAVYRQLTAITGTIVRDPVTGNVRTGPDAGTSAAFGTADGSPFVSGTTTVAFLRFQTTGTPKTDTVDGATLAVVATFAPRF
jgi:hypothetical protein